MTDEQPIIDRLETRPDLVGRFKEGDPAALAQLLEVALDTEVTRTTIRPSAISGIASIRAKLKEIQAELEKGGACELWPQLPVEDTEYCVGCEIGMITQQIEQILDENTGAP